MRTRKTISADLQVGDVKVWADEYRFYKVKPVVFTKGVILLEHCKSNFIHLCEGINEHRLTCDKDITEYVEQSINFWLKSVIKYKRADRLLWQKNM